MEENAYDALMLSFAVFVFVIAFSVAMVMFSQISTTAEVLTYYSDKTNYYDNVAVVGTEGIERYVNSETVIPTLYRYYKEHFCVKIYDATNIDGLGGSNTNPVLVQIFDVNLEGKVENAAKSTAVREATSSAELHTSKEKELYALDQIYNMTKKRNNATPRNIEILYMWGAPWLDSTDNMKLRLDYIINGDAGYINNQFIDYTDHPLHQMIEATKTNSLLQFKEKFVSYSYTGESMTTEDGDVLVTGSNPKDKIVITYTLVNLQDEPGYDSEKINAINNRKN